MAVAIVRRTRTPFVLAAPVLATAILCLVAGPARGPALARPATADRPCSARYSRDFHRNGTQVSKVAWGGEVEVTIRAEVDCGIAGIDDLQGMAITETLPAGLTLSPISPGPDGTDPPPDAWSPTEAVWRFAAGAEDGGIMIREVRYRLRAAPVDPAVSAAGEARYAWGVAFDTTRLLRREPEPLVERRPLTADIDIPLTVVVPRADSDCRLDASRRYNPETARPGDRVEVTLQFTPRGCWAFPVQTNGIIALQPPASLTEENIERSVTTARAWYDPPGGADGIYGIVWNVAPQPIVVPPTRDVNSLNAPIRAWRGELGGTAVAALNAAIDTIVRQPVSHEIVYYIGNASAVRSSPSAVAAALKSADARGIEIVPICVGGGCDPALTWAYDFPDLQRLRDAILLGRVLTEHRGTAAALTSIAVDDVLPRGARYVPGSAVTSTPGTVTADAAGLHIGPLAAQVDVPLSVRYSFTAAALGLVRYAGEGTARLVYNDAYSSARLRLPGAPLSVVAASAGTACAPPAVKTRWEPSVVLSQPVNVTVAFDTNCPTDLRRQDLVIVLDAGVTMTVDELSRIRGAVRTLLYETDALDVYAGLVTMDQRMLRVPLSANLDRIHGTLDSLGDITGGGFGEPNMSAGLAAAGDELQWRRADAAAGVILITDGYRAPEALLAAADRLKSDGVRVTTICIDPRCHPALEQAASGPSEHHAVTPTGLDALLSALAHRYGTIRIKQATIEETLPPDMHFVAGSAMPPPDEIDGRRLTWHMTTRSGAGSESVRYAVIPQTVGTDLPLGTDTRLTFVDEVDRSAATRLASPAVTVFPPGTAGPCTPDLDRLPRRTDAVAGDPITFTLSAALLCPPTTAKLDVVLVIDHSDSMASQSRLINAVRAAEGFLDGVSSGTRVGLVTFSTAVDTRLPLDADFQAVRSALSRLEASGRTAITSALVAAEGLLDARRPDALGAVVLLTDGREAAGAAPVMLATATGMKAKGIRIITVCAGDCDPELASVASSGLDALLAPDSALLVELFKGIAAELGNVQPTAIQIIEGYPEDIEPDFDKYVPLPRTMDPDRPAEAIWTFERLPRGRPQLIGVVVRPQTARIGESTRFTRLAYRFGQQPGYAYFPSGFLDTLLPTATPPPTMTPRPTLEPTGTPEPRTPPPVLTPGGQRVVWLPWAGRR